MLLQSPIEHIQAETAQHSEELSRLKTLIKELVRKQESMDQKQESMNQTQNIMNKKQDLILECLKPNILASSDTQSMIESVVSYDLTKELKVTTPATNSGDQKSSTAVNVGGEYKLQSSVSKKSSCSSNNDSSEENDDERICN